MISIGAGCLLACGLLRAEPLPTPVPEHPYLAFSRKNMERLQARVSDDPHLRTLSESLLAEADRLRREAEKRKERPHRNRDALQVLAFARAMTGDDRYGEALIEWMKAFEFGGKNEEPLRRRNPPWHTGLGAGEACAAFGQAYDAIDDLLTPELRRTFARRLAEEGIIPVLNDWVDGAERIHALDTMGHNWWSALVFEAGVGAIAILREDPRAAGWVARVRDAEAEWLQYAGSVLETKPPSFDENGGFYESIGYADFAMRSHLPFRLAWRDAFGAPPPEYPVLAKIGSFFAHAAYPRGAGQPWSLNFGDSNFATSSGVGTVVLLWGLGYRDDAVRWYLRQYLEHEDAAAKPSKSGRMGSTLEWLLHGPSRRELEAGGKTPNLPLSAIYPSMGWFMMRSSWEPDATLLALKSGFTWNHSHADAGSFMLFHRGRYLLIDSGKCGYADPAYDRYYRQSIAHNVVLFDGRAENPEDTYYGSQHPGQVLHLLDDGGLRYVLADATGPTEATFVRNFRSFLWVDGVVLVIDDLKAYEPGRFEWLLHYRGEGRQRGLDFEVNEDGVRVKVRPLFPQTLPDGGFAADFPECTQLVEKTGLADYDSGQEVPFAAFVAPGEQRRVKFVTAIVPLDGPDDEGPAIERFETKDVNGVRITREGRVTEIWLNLLADGRIRHRNANLVHDGWETDAYLTVITRRASGSAADTDAIERLMVIDGSYLRREGKIVLDSLSKVYLVARRSSDGFDVKLDGQPVINAWLRSAAKPARLVVDGEEAPVEYDAARSLFVVRRRSR